ncbi:MAG: radical SAM protein [Candidatus Omnitrophota bacterium]|nr:radical SAM protein [Candidatus Omnitrophota bacterium]
MLGENLSEDYKEKIAPGFCCLAITEKCMLKCKMCHKWQVDTFTENTPSIAQYKNFLANLRGLVSDDFIIHFGGGEALLFEGVLDLVSFCAEKGFRTNIASNGWLIDEEMAMQIADSGLTEINLSLDSLDEDVDDYLRGVKGVYRRKMKAIDFLSKYCKNTRIGICSAIYDLNLDGILPLADWVNNNDKIDSIFFMAPMQPNNTPLDKTWWRGQYGFLWPKDSAKVCLIVDKLLELKASGRKIGGQNSQLEAFKLYFRCPEKFVKKTQCNLFRAIHVSAVGDIFLCFRWEILGNIKKTDDINHILNSEQADAVRQKIVTCRDNCHFLLNCFFEGDYPFFLDK